MDVVIGIDEAGMGTLAGPATAAVVVFHSDMKIDKCRDSKTLSEAQREELAAKIMDTALFYQTQAIPPSLVDRDGLSACWETMIYDLAVAAHREFDAKIILDGNRLVGLPYVEPVVKADRDYVAVSAASILAKYVQCCWMDDYHLEYPKYGFDRHRGYGTVAHLRALEELGPCPIHRKTFKPIKRLI